jgi:hypothetical protein
MGKWLIGFFPAAVRQLDVAVSVCAGIGLAHWFGWIH